MNRDLWNESHRHHTRLHSEFRFSLGEIGLDAFRMRWEIIAQAGNRVAFALLDNREAEKDDWIFVCTLDHPFARSMMAFAAALTGTGRDCASCGGRYTKMSEWLLGEDYLCPICRYGATRCAECDQEFYARDHYLCEACR